MRNFINTRKNEAANKLQKVINKETLREIYNNVFVSEMDMCDRGMGSKEQLNQLMIAIINKKAVRMVRTNTSHKYEITFVWSKSGKLMMKTNIAGVRRTVKLNQMEADMFLQHIYEYYVMFNDLKEDEKEQADEFFYEYTK